MWNRPPHRIVALYFFLLASGLYALNASASSSLLTEYRWEKRPLLIFSPHHMDAKLQDMTSRIELSKCQLDDRDMVIGIFPATGNSRLNKRPVPPGQAAAIRHDYNIQSDTFSILLIGKDGYEKYRSEQVSDLNDIFSLIDGMPMRRQEMASKRTDCPQL